MMTINIERIIEKGKVESFDRGVSLSDRIKQGYINYAIDTTAKVGCYAPIMAAMEAYNGLDGEQILQSRVAAALVDAGIARIYTKTADYMWEKTKSITPKISRNSIKLTNTLRKMFGKENLTFGQKRKVYQAVEGIRNYSTDTASMVGVYTPVYTGILAAAGADAKQIGSSLLMGAGIAAATSRPFRKYALMPWRKLWGYKK